MNEVQLFAEPAVEPEFWSLVIVCGVAAAFILWMVVTDIRAWWSAVERSASDEQEHDDDTEKRR